MTADPTSEPSEHDRIEATQDLVREATIRYAEEVNDLLVRLMRHGPRAAARAMHLVTEITGNTLAVLATIGEVGPYRKRKKVIPADADYAMASFDGGETFGAQAVQQLVAIARPLIAANAEKAQASAAGQVAAEVESLTQALATARRDGLGAALCAALEERLQACLHQAPAPDAPGDLGTEPTVAVAAEATP